MKCVCPSLLAPCNRSVTKRQLSACNGITCGGLTVAAAVAISRAPSADTERPSLGLGRSGRSGLPGFALVVGSGKREVAAICCTSTSGEDAIAERVIDHHQWRITAMPVPVGGVGGLPVPPHTRRRCACIAGGTATPPRQRLCGKQVPESVDVHMRIGFVWWRLWLM